MPGVRLLLHEIIKEKLMNKRKVFGPQNALGLYSHFFFLLFQVLSPSSWPTGTRSSQAF